MKEDLAFKERSRLKAKIAVVLKENLAGLRTELQQILVDDLVTAFENRRNVLMRVERKRLALVD